MFLYAGEYESVEGAKADLKELKELHNEHVVVTNRRRPNQERRGQGRDSGQDRATRFLTLLVGEAGSLMTGYIRVLSRFPGACDG
jgi:hypothetical protein